MELCEHLKPYYQKEIKAGNTVKGVLGNISDTGWRMGVFFKYPLKSHKKIRGDVELSNFITPHYPWRKAIICNKCKMSLEFPYNEEHMEAPGPNAQIDPRIIADEDTVIADYDVEFSGLPTVK